jgi:hypothetical protein
MIDNKVFAPVDTSWFDENQEQYLSTEDSVNYQKIIGFNRRYNCIAVATKI